MYHKNKDIRAIRSKEWLFQALCQLIEEKDYNSITITELIQRAGVGRSTFYRNFDVIEDVLVEKLDRKFEEFYEFVFTSREMKESDLSPKLFIPVFEYWKDDSYLLEIFIKVGRRDILHKAFTNYVSQILNTYDLIDLSKEEMAYSTVILAGIVESVLVKWVESGKRETASQLANIIVETTFNNKKAHQ